MNGDKLKVNTCWFTLLNLQWGASPFIIQMFWSNCQSNLLIDNLLTKPLKNMGSTQLPIMGRSLQPERTSHLVWAQSESFNGVLLTYVYCYWLNTSYTHVIFSWFDSPLKFVRTQVWVKGSKPSGAAASDLEATDLDNWGVGSNVTTKLINPAGEVCYVSQFNFMHGGW